LHRRPPVVTEPALGGAAALSAEGDAER
jgi:hypothetical protein